MATWAKSWRAAVRLATSLVMMATVVFATTGGRAAAAGSFTQDSMTFQGRTRTFWVYIPASYDATQPVPLVFVLHGSGGGTGSSTCNNSGGAIRPTQQWRDIADAEPHGMIVVCPDAVVQQDQEQRWNDCRGDWSQPAVGAKMDMTIDDVGFVQSMIDQVSGELNIDRHRVYATGISNGGMMALRLALQLPGVFAAIAPVAASMAAVPQAACASATPSPITVVLFNGTTDPAVPYGGGKVEGGTCGCKGGGASGTVISAEATRDFWRNVDATTVSAPVTQLADPNLKDGGDGSAAGCVTKTDSVIQQQEYTDGAAYGSGSQTASQVVFEQVVNGGHTMPDITYNDVNCLLTVGNQNKDVDAPVLIWSMIRQYTT